MDWDINLPHRHFFIKTLLAAVEGLLIKYIDLHSEKMANVVDSRAKVSLTRWNHR